jgi:pimeloyl-ACP methyl ester carboxylesterase
MKKMIIAFCLFFFGVCLIQAQPYRDLLEWQKNQSEKCMDAVLKKDFIKAYDFFSPEMKKEFSVDTFAIFWGMFEKKAGKPYKVFDTRIDIDPEDSNLRTIIHALRCSNGNWEIRMSFKGTQLVDGFYIDKYQPRYDKRAYTVADYVDSDSIKVRDITIGKGTDWETNGILTLPLKQGRYPIVIIIHGSGPLDEDGTYVANKPYADLAWGLASKGIGVLRFPKRTRKYYSAIKDKGLEVTPDLESTEDAIAAFDAIAQFRETDTSNIYFLGHGTGGMIIPRALEATKNVKGVILMGAPARSLPDVLLEQLEYVLSLDTLIEKSDSKKKIEAIRKQYQSVNSPKLSKDTPAKSLLLETPASYWLALRGYNPVQTLKKSKVPVLILQGERDFQANMKDFALWKKSLIGKGLHPQSLAKSYSMLNYLFMEGVGKSHPSEYAIFDHIPEEVITDIAQWIKKTSTK